MNIRNLLSLIYLILAVCGFVFPTLSNIEYASTYGFTNLLNFIDLANINPAAQSLSRDLFIGASSVTIWIINESKRLKMKNTWIVYLSFLIAFAFAAPLFLFLRERRLIEMEKDSG